MTALLVTATDGRIDPVENAVISRLANNWSRRATVKRTEPSLDDLFEPARADYPEHILPFRDHPTYLALAPEMRAKVLAWAWIAYNRHTVIAEQRVANPAFGLVLQGEFPGAYGEALELSLVQAMVDEQYHTLMHMNGSAVTRRRRGWAMPDSALPISHTAREHERLRMQARERWQRSLTTLAFATVSEISINAYLDLLADDPHIQVINSTTARLHNRDEYCHMAITAELAKMVWIHLSDDQRQYFLRMLGSGLEAFVATDYTTWYRIVDLVGIPDGAQMVADAQADTSRKRLIRDYTGLYRLCQELEVLDRVDFDWSTSEVQQ
jgi:alpha-N-dichloroacetyl-p-aminophenylserinol N-oxygenase